MCDADLRDAESPRGSSIIDDMLGLLPGLLRIDADCLQAVSLDVFIMIIAVLYLNGDREAEIGRLYEVRLRNMRGEDHTRRAPLLAVIAACAWHG